MALVCEANIAGMRLVTYNLHLESRGDNQLRCSQLNDCLSDSTRYKATMPIVLAGDFNLDVFQSCAGNALANSQFRSAFSPPPAQTTPNSFFERGRPIDWIFLRGPVRSRTTRVHSSVSASDHYPLSSLLAFT